MGQGGNAHGEAQHHDHEESKNERAPLADSIRYPGEDDGEDGGDDVDGDGEELGRARDVSEVLDNGRQEQADAVEGADNLQPPLASGRRGTGRPAGVILTPQ